MEKIQCEVFTGFVDRSWLVSLRLESGQEKKRSPVFFSLKYHTYKRLASALPPAGHRAEASSSCPRSCRMDGWPQLQWSRALASTYFPVAFVLPMELPAARQRSGVRASLTLSPALVLQTAQFLIPAFHLRLGVSQALEITNTRAAALQTQTADEDSSGTHLHSWNKPEFPWQATQTEKKRKKKFYPCF